MFGEHPEDVVAMVNTGAETLAQLGDLFRSIALEAGEHTAAKRLAKLGSYMADDFANLLDQQQESLGGALKLFMAGEPTADENSPTNAPVDAEYKDRFYKLNMALCATTLKLLQIKAVARLVSEEHAFNQPAFSQEVYGGVLSILEMSTHAYDELSDAV